LPVEVDDSGRVQPVDLTHRGEVDVESFPVVVGTEIVQAGVGTGPHVQRAGIQRILRGHCRHHVEDLLGFGAESGLGQIFETNRVGGGFGHATYVTLSFVMVVDFGRPRDPRIDSAVLRATVELLAQTGYPGLLVSAIAQRAGTSKPAIYRRWPSKAHLVHEAVFPLGAATAIPDTGSLPEDLHEMVRRTMAVLTTPAAKAALPGLVGEMAADPTLHSALLERFADIIAGDLALWLENAAGRGEVRANVTAAELAQALAGITLVALLTHVTELDDAWIDRTTTLLLKGISA
jgi:AcrR family transcriptional regulator